MADDRQCTQGETPLVWNQQGPAAETPINIVGGDPLAGGQADGFAKLDGIAGESADAQHPGEIDVKSFAFGLKDAGGSGSGGGGGAGKAQFSNLRFAKLYDSASPKLMLASASGQHIKSVVFTFRRPGQSATFLTYKLSDVVVAGYEQGGDEQRPQLEHVELSFSKVEITYQPASGGAPVTAGWDLKGNVSV